MSRKNLLLFLIRSRVPCMKIHVPKNRHTHTFVLAYIRIQPHVCSRTKKRKQTQTYSYTHAHTDTSAYNAIMYRRLRTQTIPTRRRSVIEPVHSRPIPCVVPRWFLLILSKRSFSKCVYPAGVGYGPGSGSGLIKMLSLSLRLSCSRSRAANELSREHVRSQNRVGLIEKPAFTVLRA